MLHCYRGRRRWRRWLHCRSSYFLRPICFHVSSSRSFLTQRYPPAFCDMFLIFLSAFGKVKRSVCGKKRGPSSIYLVLSVVGRPVPGSAAKGKVLKLEVVQSRGGEVIADFTRRNVAPGSGAKTRMAGRGTMYLQGLKVYSLLLQVKHRVQR